jgi:hypothetical protein
MLQWVDRSRGIHFMRMAALGAWIVFAMGAFATAFASAADPADAAALRARYAELRTRLEASPFGRPLHVDSRELGAQLEGEVHAVVDQPFGSVRSALSDPVNWCRVLTLPFNVLRCDSHGDLVRIHVGRKPTTPVEDATVIELRFRVVAREADFLKVSLSAPSGPAGTRDYRIAFSALPVEGNRTLVHLSYGYANGTLSRLALQAYLATSGAHKVGFSTHGMDPQGRPALVGGMRGLTERNTMRYFLAIEAFLASLDAPPEQRLRARLEHWFDATERYPRQLREMTRAEYLELKTRAAARDHIASN